MGKKIAVILIGMVLLISAIAPAALATPEKAKQTGKDCSGCHPNAGPHAKYHKK